MAVSNSSVSQRHSVLLTIKNNLPHTNLLWHFWMISLFYYYIFIVQKNRFQGAFFLHVCSVLWLHFHQYTHVIPCPPQWLLFFLNRSPFSVKLISIFILYLIHKTHLSVAQKTYKSHHLREWVARQSFLSNFLCVCNSILVRLRKITVEKDWPVCLGNMACLIDTNHALTPAARAPGCGG